jgi:hypothetical protein
MRPLLLLLALLASAGCGGDREQAPDANSAEELENRIENLAVLREETPPQRLAYLREGDLWPQNRTRPACRLHQQGRLLLVANESGAVVRVDGQRRSLMPAGPIGPTGGFFRGAGVTVSVGRTSPVAAEADAYGPGAAARATVGGREDVPPERHEARWICGA